MFLILTLLCITTAQIVPSDIEVLNELPLDKLLLMKTSLQDLVTADYENVTVTTPSYLQTFGAQAMAVHSQPPIKRGDYEEISYKKGENKLGNIFSISVTTLAFLAFGGYLLCLIVHAVRAKNQYNGIMPNPTQPSFFVSAGIKKRPHTQFSSYGRRRRDNRIRKSLGMLDVSPDKLFTALLQVCEGYAKWSEKKEGFEV